ncbi:MAG: hypothetical protein GC186_18635 [Rhodobacteraceae bacterium]|nr:hypothetical protein [Paracoccaceae bacterium]
MPRFPAALAALLGATLLAPAAGADVRFAGGDGHSAETAIVIEGASGESDGVAAEYAWLKQNRPGADLQSQAVMAAGGRSFDVLTVGNGGKHERVFFDITGFFGK